MATPFARIESSTCSGSGVPYLSMTSAPASWTSQSNATPVASSTRRVASQSSGPTPSPGMKVTRYVMARVIVSDEGDARTGLGRLGLVAAGKGLEEVVAAQTAISDIDGKLGKLWYVGYSIDDLAQHSPFEEVTSPLHYV